MAIMAVVKIGGSQYQVTPDDKIVVDKLVGDKDQEVVFEQVLLVEKEGKVKIGQPVVVGAKVKAVIEEQCQGDKIRVAVYRSKSRHRRAIGFRAKLTKIKITAIELKEK